MALIGISELFLKVVGRYPPLRESILGAHLHENWQACLGQTVSRYVTYVSLFEGHLSVRVAHPTWHQQIRAYPDPFIQKINAFIEAEVPTLLQSKVLSIEVLGTKWESKWLGSGAKTKKRSPPPQLSRKRKKPPPR